MSSEQATASAAAEVNASIDAGNAAAEGKVDDNAVEASADESEEIVEGEEGASDEVAAAQEAKIIKDLKKKFKLKVDGEEIEEEIDLSNDEEMVKRLQLAKASQKRMQESAKLKRDIESFFKALNENPEEVLEKMGLDLDGLSEKRINKKLEEMQKSPEQKEKEKIVKELEKLRKEKEKSDAEKQAAEMARLQDQYAMQIENEITESLKNSKLPKSPYVVKRIADSLMFAMKNGYNVGVKDILPNVEKQIVEEINNMFEVMPEEVMEQVIGQQNLNRLRKRRVSKGKTAVETAKDIKATAEATKAKNEEDKNKPKLSYKDFFKNL